MSVPFTVRTSTPRPTLNIPLSPLAVPIVRLPAPCLMKMSPVGATAVSCADRLPVTATFTGVATAVPIPFTASIRKSFAVTNDAPLTVPVTALLATSVR